jgi:predicted CXXCH cytochrome family protein
MKGCGQSRPVGSVAVLFLLSTTMALCAHAKSDYVGNAACTRCHATAARDWSVSLHRRILQPATANSVQGNFTQGKVVLQGATYVLVHRNGSYYIAESSSGAERERRVDYTLGGWRFQLYLTTAPDGRILILPPAWDILNKRWIHEADTDNPEDAPGVPVQVWNKTCASCHVSRVEKNFDLAQLRYATKWQDFGVNCESCHGPGGEHVAQAAKIKVPDVKAQAAARAAILNPARLDAARSTTVCAACHSLHDTYAPGYRPGANYYDFFLPVLQYRVPAEGSPYWPDGRPAWMSNEVVALWQSRCFLKGGATCTTCHTNPHNVDVGANPQLRSTNNALCAKCHSAIVTNVAAHSHHPAGTPGSACVNCHMPPAVASLGVAFQDHSMSIPVPENTVRHGIPNACNMCHQDKGVDWAARQMDGWWGDQQRRQLIARTDAFAQARKHDPAAVSALLEILADTSAGPIVRANAAGFLGDFGDFPAAYDAVFHALQDPEPLVRAAAADAIRPRAAQREAVAPELVRLLGDSVRTVRMSAVIALVAMGVREVPPPDEQRFQQAKADYAVRAELNDDDAQQQLAAGRFFYLAGDMDSAVADFRAALKLDPAVQAQYFLALALERKGEHAEARQVIASIPRGDPQYEPAQRLLAEIESTAAAQPAAPGSSTTPDNQAEKQFLDARVQYQNQAYGAALDELEKALQSAPQASWAAQARRYRAVCLEKLGRAAEAEPAMQALAGSSEARQDVDFQLAYLELLSDSSRFAEALKRVDDLIAAVPNAAMAYFWRAKLLLQLERVGEAATAAEQSVRLLPNLAAAHNLLLRIYQRQGRTKEAAEQAEWLRDYQRRLQSR